MLYHIAMLGIGLLALIIVISVLILGVKAILNIFKRK